MSDFAKLRERMVRRQIEARGITSSLILDAFRQVPREAFVDDGQRGSAYEDHPLPIDAGQTISQPYIVALMIEAAEVAPGDVVLEVGSGSGYAAAIMSRIARAVIGIERRPELVGSARERLNRLGYHNVMILEGDGTCGWPDHAPFNAILAAAAGSHVPTPLIDQLAPGGRLVMPIGQPSDVQDLIKVMKRPDGSLVEENLGAVRFVPLIGEEGWRDG
jgi:protein-L-isoaspartate(D-aspartate) O-methyltransferase